MYKHTYLNLLAIVLCKSNTLILRLKGLVRLTRRDICLPKICYFRQLTSRDVHLPKNRYFRQLTSGGVQLPKICHFRKLTSRDETVISVS